MEQTPPYYKNEVMTVREVCNSLLNRRQRIDDQKYFARLVIKEILDNGQIDLCMLRPKQSPPYEDATHLLSALIGFDSSVFKTICSDYDLFHLFLHRFCAHANRSLADPFRVEESVYIWLLGDYVRHVLPTSDSNAFAVAKSWFAAGEPSRANAPVRTPFGLLRPEVLAKSTRPQMFDTHPSTVRRIPPSLQEFVPALVHYYASSSSWPSMAQLRALRVVMSQYGRFLCADSDNKELYALKRSLPSDAQFIRTMQTFLARQLEVWALEKHYVALIDLWLALVYPGHEVFLDKDNTKLEIFLTASAGQYIDFVDIMVHRFVRANVETALTSGFVDALLRKVFHPHILKIFDMMNLPTNEYVEATYRTLKTFHNDYRRKMQQQQASASAKPSLLDQVKRYFAGGAQGPAFNIAELERCIAILETRLYGDKLPPDSAVGGAVRSGGSTTTAEGSVRMRHPSGGRLAGLLAHEQDNALAGTPLHPIIPDHKVDPWTKMLYLTPLGRWQVINRIARFDFSQYSPQIKQMFPNPSGWEIPCLFHLLQRWSVKWSANSRFVRYMKNRRHDSVVASALAKAFLSPASPPRYMPMISKRMPHRPASLDLRIFSSIPFWIFFIFLVWWLSRLVISFFA